MPHVRHTFGPHLLWHKKILWKRTHISYRYTRNGAEAKLKPEAERLNDRPGCFQLSPRGGANTEPARSRGAAPTAGRPQKLRRLQFFSRKSKRRSALPHIIDHMIPKREQSSFTLKASNTSRQPDCPRFAGLSRHRWTPCKRRILSSDLVLSPAHTPTATSSHAAPSVPHVSSS